MSKDCEQKWGKWVTEIKTCSEGHWSGTQALYGFEVSGKDITRVEIRCGCLNWARNLDKVDAVRVDKPGKICWPLWLTFYYRTYLFIESETKPTDIKILSFDVNQTKFDDYNHGAVTAYDFNSEDADSPGAIAKFQSGLNGAALCTCEHEEVQKYVAKMRKSAATNNKSIDPTAETTMTIGVY